MTEQPPKTGYYYARFKSARTPIWPYSTNGELLFKRGADGFGYHQINSDIQERTRWDWWRNYLLWRITRFLNL